MEKLSEDELFCCGVNVGVRLYQSKLVEAHKRKEGLLVGDTIYYIQDGRERLQEVIDKICR